jgi:hypothetical protein
MKPERAAQKKLSLPMKDISKIVALLGLVVSAIAWMHAEVTVPKILQQTKIQIDESVKEHSKFPHPVSASRREFEMLKGAIEASMDDFKEDTRQRLGRIESKLDRL